MTDPTTPTTASDDYNPLCRWCMDRKHRAEAAASALSARERLIEAFMQPWVWERYMRGGHSADARTNAGLLADAVVAHLNGTPLTREQLVAADRAAFGYRFIAKAEPEPKCEHGVPVALACRACRDAKAKPEGES